MTSSKSILNNSSNNNTNKISFGRKVSKDNMNRSSFKLDISMEDEKIGKSIHANKNLKKSLIVQDKNTLNILNNNDNNNKETEIVHAECFIDNKLKSLINFKNKSEMKPTKKLSILNLLNFSIRSNYFLTKVDNFSLINEYMNSLNLNNEK